MGLEEIPPSLYCWSRCSTTVHPGNTGQGYYIRGCYTASSTLLPVDSKEPLERDTLLSIMHYLTAEEARVYKKNRAHTANFIRKSSGKMGSNCHEFIRLTYTDRVKWDYVIDVETWPFPIGYRCKPTTVYSSSDLEDISASWACVLRTLIEVTTKTHICSVKIHHLLIGKRTDMCRPDLAPKLGEELINSYFLQGKIFSSEPGSLVVGYHPEAYLNKRQNKTVFVVCACPRWDSIGTKIRRFFGVIDDCTVATDTVGVNPGTEGYELLLQHERERVERLVERLVKQYAQGEGTFQLHALAEFNDYFGEVDGVTTKNAQSVLNMMLWLAGENRLQRYCVRKLEEDFGYICRNTTEAHDLYWAALGGWDLATERNGDNDAQWKAARSRAGLYLAAGGKKALKTALGDKFADVSDDKLRLLAGVGGVANAMKMLRVENLVGVPDSALKQLASCAGLYLAAGGTKAIEKALGMKIADVSDETLRLLAGLRGVANAKKLLGVESFVDVVNLNEKLFTASKWWKLYQVLVAFKSKFGHTLVPKAYVVNGLNLGSWVNNQRSEWKRKQNGKKDSWLTDERVLLLNDLKFVWNAYEAQWLENYEALQQFKEEHGHVRVKQQYNTEDGLKLGKWVNNQRSEWKRKQNGKEDSWLTVERIAKLNNLKFAWKLSG